MEFEWDENKNQKNILKHGINFILAEKFFSGQYLVKTDNRKSFGEERLVAIGELEDRIIAVVFTRRRINIRRIISMRRARKDEQRKYRALPERYERHD